MNTMHDVQQKIATDLGIGDLSGKEQEKLIAEFGAVALQASTIAVLEAMTPANRAEFTKLLATKDEGGAQAFLTEHVPNHEAIARQAVATEIARFKEFQKTL
jgi:hypothetical protein